MTGKYWAVMPLAPRPRTNIEALKGGFLTILCGVSDILLAELEMLPFQRTIGRDLHEGAVCGGEDKLKTWRNDFASLDFVRQEPGA